RVLRQVGHVDAARAEALGVTEVAHDVWRELVLQRAAPRERVERIRVLVDPARVREIVAGRIHARKLWSGDDRRQRARGQVLVLLTNTERQAEPVRDHERTVGEHRPAFRLRAAEAVERDGRDGEVGRYAHAAGNRLRADRRVTELGRYPGPGPAVAAVIPQEHAADPGEPVVLAGQLEL